MKQFTDVALTAIPQPFELVSDSANVNYRGALDNGIVWDMYQALHAELQDANGIACYPGGDVRFAPKHISPGAAKEEQRRPHQHQRRLLQRQRPQQGRTRRRNFARKPAGD